MRTHNLKYQTLVEKAKKGFKNIYFHRILKDKAVKNISLWLDNDLFETYTRQIIYLINTKKWEILLDSFYRVIPFGTGGRRGLVGVGPNRINICTAKLSAQGFSQYLIKKFGCDAFHQGIVLAYDARESTIEGISVGKRNSTISSRQLAESSAEIYAANGIKTYIFSAARTTPALSFSVKYLKAVGGCMFTASHNPPQYNGEKFYDHNGSQFVPPTDEEILYEIKKYESKIKKIRIKYDNTDGLIIKIDNKIDNAYYEQVKATKLSNERGIKILYSPLHGTGITSVLPILSQLGFDIHLDKNTSNLSGRFENISFNIPNPEFVTSFDSLIKSANSCDADIIMSTDSDADRLGIMVKHNGEWIFLNGNQIGIILAEYILTHIDRKNCGSNRYLVIKTWVTTSLVNIISSYNDVDCIADLPVGFRYICNEVNELTQKGLENFFLLGFEESHGYLVGSYCGDKDAAGASVLIAELAAKLKGENSNLINYINEIYCKYGYCYNYSTSINFDGINKSRNADYIMDCFRKETINAIGSLDVIKKVDKWQGSPHLSKTDTASRNMITFFIKNPYATQPIKITIRPSGTESKLKVYIEIFELPFDRNNTIETEKNAVFMRKKIEVDLMKQCFNLLDFGSF